MPPDTGSNQCNTVGLEHPLFGQFARQMFQLRTRDLEDCLGYQRRHGGRLGEIHRARNLLTHGQILQILRGQARWVARACGGDVRPNRFPVPHFLSFCLPAYNEELNIWETLNAARAMLPQFVARFEIIVVDDGSTDATAAVVSRYSAEAPEVRLIRHAANRGYGAAVTSGLQAARGDLVAFTDADGQFSFLDLPQLLTNLNGHDVVVGYRFHRVDSLLRRFNGWAWSRLIRLLLHVRVRDIDCAFKLFRRSIVDRLELSATGAAINAEIMTQCAQVGARICELPVMHYPRYHGAPTGAALGVIAKAFRELPQLFKYRKRAEMTHAALRRLRS